MNDMGNFYLATTVTPPLDTDSPTVNVKYLGVHSLPRYPTVDGQVLGRSWGWGGGCILALPLPLPPLLSGAILS